MRPPAFALLAVILALSSLCGAQTPDNPSASAPTAQAQAPSPPPAPRPAPTSTPQTANNDTCFYCTGIICGAGASYSAAATKPTFGCGAGAMLVPMPVFIEVGLMGPQANRSYLSGYVSVDGNIQLAPSSAKYLPIAIFGYTRFFETGHALDYGLALSVPRPGKKKDPGASLRLELRDYWTFANPNQHNFMLRIGWMSQESD